MLSKISLTLLLLYLSGCTSWDSKKFEPSQVELHAADKIEMLQKTDVVDIKKCQIIGDLKLLTYAKGQPANVVALRKYSNATLIQHTASRMHGSVLGEGSTDFFDVYKCEK